jgi:hypothetical protein
MTLTNVNTYLGETQISAGGVILGANASIDDTPWIGMNTATTLDVSSKGGAGYTYDGVISGGGVGALKADNTNRATIVGNFVVGDGTGSVCLVGSMTPGNSSLNTVATAGDQVGQMNVTGNLTLSGAIAGTSTSTTRLTLQANTATTSLFALGWDGTSSITAFVDGLSTGTPDQQGALNGTFGNLSGHDYVNVGGTLTVNSLGDIAVTHTGFLQGGEVFNLLDWSSVTGFGATNGSGFYVGNRTQDGTAALSVQDLQLATLSSGLFWDTSLFATYGVLVVVPEPSKALFLMLGLLGLMLRRRRRYSRL